MMLKRKKRELIDEALEAELELVMLIDSLTFFASESEAKVGLGTSRNLDSSSLLSLFEITEMGPGSVKSRVREFCNRRSSRSARLSILKGNPLEAE
mgnify:CR=1 FL=1